MGNDHPFFRPLWRRVAIVGVCLVWAGVELWYGETLWVAIVLAIAAYAAWVFLISYDPGPGPGDGEPRA